MIRWLLTKLLFAGTMMFAAAPVVVGGGAGAGANSGEGGAGSGGGAGEGGNNTDAGGGNADTGRAIPGAGDKGQGAGAGEGTEAAAQGDDDFEIGDFDTPEAGEFEDKETGSADEFGPDVYKTVKEALKAHPNEFKAIKKAVSMVKRYQEHIESPEALGELLTNIQTLGGLEAIQKDMGETATFLNGWNAGDGEVVKAWIKENSEGLAKNMPAVNDEWRAADPQGWAHDICRTFQATMLQANQETGISPMAALQQLAAIEGVKDSPAYKSIMAMVEVIKNHAAQAPQPQKKAPDEAKLTEREQKIKQGEWEVTKGRLSSQATPMLAKEATNALKLVAGNRKLSEQSKTALVNDIHGEFARVVAKMDPMGKDKRQKLLTAGQHEQWLKLVKSAAARYMPIAARNVWRKYAGISGLSTQQKQERKAEAGQQREAGAKGAATTAIEMKKPGDGRQVDKPAMIAKFGSRDKAEDAFLWGLKETGNKRVWIEKGTGKMYSY